ncbi:MAG: hypothetical protein LBT26_06545 [Clostridiales Family XIII bacterium]|jgi:hypothetical protein|nr:hypothetical protein [Clostridiales Family XIII bacterium]
MQKQITPAENGNFEMVLHAAMELPGVKINRTRFLRKELSKYFDEDVVKRAIETNPAQAGLSIESLEKIAKACIDSETAKATAMSAAAGIPGGLAMLATVPLDIAQFFGCVIRVLQKLVYLYGWQEMFHGDEDGLDDEMFNQLILFIGVMFGVNAANAAIARIADAAAIKMEKALVQKALMKGAIYPAVKQVAKLIGVEMTKQIFAKGVGKTIPVVGAVVSGGITFLGFRPMAKRLQKHLIALPMASVDFYRKSYDNDEAVIDIDFSDIIVEDVDGF